MSKSVSPFTDAVVQAVDAMRKKIVDPEADRNVIYTIDAADPPGSRTVCVFSVGITPFPKGRELIAVIPVFATNKAIAEVCRQLQLSFDSVGPNRHTKLMAIDPTRQYRWLIDFRGTPDVSTTHSEAQFAMVTPMLFLPYGIRE